MIPKLFDPSEILMAYPYKEYYSNFYTSVCPVCKTDNDTQEHSLICTELRKWIKKDNLTSMDAVVYTDLFGDTDKQHQITQVYKIIIKTREKLRTPTINPAYPGQNTGPADG